MMKNHLDLTRVSEFDNKARFNRLAAERSSQEPLNDVLMGISVSRGIVSGGEDQCLGSTTGIAVSQDRNFTSYIG